MIGPTVRWLHLVPWLLAIAGLAIPMSQSPTLWPIVLGWVVVIALAWVVGRLVVTTRAQRLAVGLVTLPVLILPLAWWGGWWLIPADLAWLLLEVLDRRSDERRERATG